MTGVIFLWEDLRGLLSIPHKYTALCGPPQARPYRKRFPWVTLSMVFVSWGFAVSVVCAVVRIRSVCSPRVLVHCEDRRVGMDAEYGSVGLGIGLSR